MHTSASIVDARSTSDIERLDILDAMRGFALGGIFLLNLAAFSWPLMVVAMISAQVAFCRWWLARFAFGPMEWIWRQAPYGRRLGMRRRGQLSAVS